MTDLIPFTVARQFSSLANGPTAREVLELAIPRCYPQSLMICEIIKTTLCSEERAFSMHLHV
jgi:hypothetical protein